MHNIIKGDEPCIPCTCKADTPSANLHNLQRTQWQTEPDLAASPTSVLEIPKAAVAAMIKTPVAGPRAAAAAAAMIKAPAPVAVGLTPMEMSASGTNPGAITAVTRARQASR
jgi:hypothetical protein